MTMITPAPSPTYLLEVQNLRKYYGGVKAVDDVGFSLAAGELLALIGPNGAGKSTCFNLINGQITPDSGRVLLNGNSIESLTPAQKFFRGISRTFQVAATFSSMTVLENIQMALLSKDRLQWRMTGSARRYKEEVAMNLLAQVNMAEQASRPASVLAYGDIKRLELAIALASDPIVLLMDEPTAGMAPNERLALMDLTKQLARKQQIGVLFTEHSMDAVFGYADRVIVLAAGRLIAQGSVAQVRADPLVQQVYLGLPPPKAMGVENA
jgi:branched-chain amino acid transport system ATP-binding protein